MPDEAGEQAHVRQRADLGLDAVLLVEEPPGGAVLHLAGHGAVLEVAAHRREAARCRAGSGCRGWSWPAGPLVEAVEEARQRPRHLEVADGVVAGVRAERRAGGVLMLRIAPRWNCCTQPRSWSMSARRWRSARLQRRARAARRARGRRAAVERRRDLGVGVGRGVGSSPARDRRRGSRARGRRRGGASSASRSVVEAAHRRFRRRLQLADPRVPGRGIVHRQRLVRTPGRIDAGGRAPCARRACWCGSRMSTGSSVVQTTATFELRSRPRVVKLVLAAAAGCSGRRSRARCRAPAARRRRTDASAPCASSGRAGCAASRAPCAPRPRTSPSPRRRRSSSARGCRRRAWRATCSGRPPARSR